MVLPEELPEPELDKDKVIAVIVNLLGNAAKYTPVGGRVSLKVKVEEGQLRVTVEDTGFGIVPEEVDKVFDKFFRSTTPACRRKPAPAWACRWPAKSSAARRRNLRGKRNQPGQQVHGDAASSMRAAGKQV